MVRRTSRRRIGSGSRPLNRRFVRTVSILFQAVAAGTETLADVDRRVREKQRKAAIDRAEQHPSVRSAAEILGARVKRVELGEN